jgi:hypothetical protein
MNIIESIIIVVFSILCAVAIPDANKYSVYANPEQELAFQLQSELVDQELREEVEIDIEKQKRLDILIIEIRVAYAVYAPLPIAGSGLANYITEKVSEFNEIADGDGCIYFDEEIPELGITTITSQVIGFGRYPQEGE